jgi:hypothetical protein
VRIDDPQVMAASGKTHHPIVKFNGRSDSRVSGKIFEITDAELASADQYEVAGTNGAAAMLASGKQAWSTSTRAWPQKLQEAPRSRVVLPQRPGPSYCMRTVGGITAMVVPGIVKLRACALNPNPLRSLWSDRATMSWGLCRPKFAQLDNTHP